MKNTLLILILFISSVNATGSGFGFVNNTLGNTVLPFSASGVGRSYEIAHSDSLQINFKNFATLSNISRTTLTINSNYSAFFAENNLGKTYNNNGGFEGAFLGIPLKEKTLNIGIGLQPFSSINQKTLKITNDGLEKGVVLSGGLGKAGVHFSYIYNSDLSVALGYEYSFGRIDEIEQISEATLDVRTERSFQASGIVISVFTNILPNLNLGMVIKPNGKGSTTYKAKTSSVALNIPKEVDLTLPVEINIGAEYKFSESYYSGIDFSYQNWKNGYKIDNKSVSGHKDFYYVGMGVERKGSSRKFVNYINQIDLRAGVFYKNLAQTYNFNNVNEIGLSLGVSLPIIKFRSKIDLAGFISKRGDLNTHSLEETIVGLKFSISANELWFVNIED